MYFKKLRKTSKIYLIYDILNTKLIEFYSIKK